MSGLRMLGLVALVLGVMAIVPTIASATTLDLAYNSGGILQGEGEKFLEIHLPLSGTTGFCAESRFIGEVTSEGSSTTTAKASLSKFYFGICLGGAVGETDRTGTLEFHTAEAENDGTVTSSGFTFHVNTSSFTCWYETSNTDFGVVTGSTATLDVKASVPLLAGGPFCSPNAILEGPFSVNFIVT